MLQWQKCVGRGSEDVGIVKESVEDLQRQVAVCVVVGSAIVGGSVWRLERNEGLLPCWIVLHAM